MASVNVTARRGRRRRIVVLGSCVSLALIAVIYTWIRPNLDPDRLWDRSQLALRANRLDQAESCLARIRWLRRPTTLDLMLEAQVAIARGRVDSALGILDKIPEADPLHAEACLLAGRLERQRKRMRLAEARFLQALKADPTLVGAHKELIYVYGVQLRRREVDAEYRALAKLVPLTHHDLFTWAQTHFSSWSPDIAAELQAFVDADPDDRQSRLALAELLVDQPGESGRVERLLDALPDSDPDAIALRVALALHLNRRDEAEALLKRGPADHPTLARLQGRLALQRRDPTAAIVAFREALSREPYDRVSALEYGQALLLKGDRAEANIYLDRARRLNEVYNLVNQVRSPDRENRTPDLARIAAAFESAGLLSEAQHWYSLTLARDPINPEAQRALHRLKIP
ncbi:hypothetical protein [Singulisphaera sp. PoT]|uniref:tetratricopeptide repeat protein n=1 Tax=Singulisphaera sp. PoT TaxID=3411797 RepID=UPI003BF50CAC